MIKPLGLYIHIPYCRALCHYCDFAKTALFDRSHVSELFNRLEQHLHGWLHVAQVYGWIQKEKPDGSQMGFSSVFFGGGTPSLFVDEYTPIMDLIRPWLLPGAEVTLEANPDDVNTRSLTAWRHLGFNRLSMGIQTFHDKGLMAMRRIHRGKRAREALAEALDVFPNLNVDLIYGWPHQTQNDFVQDLSQITGIGVPHVSLYNLTFESQTPLGRAATRGILKPHGDEALYGFYREAMEQLATAGFLQEEVSNWSKPGASCVHNWLYWDDAPFIGIGPGAHGYLRVPEPWGLRYAYPRSDRRFLRTDLEPTMKGSIDFHMPDLPVWVLNVGAEVDNDRHGGEAWLMEYVGASLRTKRGVNLSRIESFTQRSFLPTGVLQEALDRELCKELVTDQGERRLVFTPDEWFREVAWGGEVLASFSSPRQGKG